jgi:hypothetical protein
VGVLRRNRAWSRVHESSLGKSTECVRTVARQHRCVQNRSLSEQNKEKIFEGRRLSMIPCIPSYTEHG